MGLIRMVISNRPKVPFIGAVSSPSEASYLAVVLGVWEDRSVPLT